MPGTDKITRILILFYRLSKGEYIDKTAFAAEHNITERSFDRDVEDIRIFLSEIYTKNELLFDKARNGYFITGRHQIDFSGVEIVALLKILISSRAFRKDEMVGLVSAIVSLVPADKKANISQLLCSELESYISPQHNKAILKIHWDVEQCILRHQIIELNYYKANGEQVRRRVLPISIVFSEHYFYLVAFRDNEEYDYPAFFRLDRIESFLLTKDKYPQKLFEQYNVGTMKQCIQFMYAGNLFAVKLKCRSSVLEPVLDRLPNAEVIERKGDFVIITAKVFGDGFIRWVLSQGKTIEVLEPPEFREKVKHEVSELLTLYTKGKDAEHGEKN